MLEQVFEEERRAKLFVIMGTVVILLIHWIPYPLNDGQRCTEYGSSYRFLCDTCAKYVLVGYPVSYPVTYL